MEGVAVVCFVYDDVGFARAQAFQALPARVNFHFQTFDFAQVHCDLGRFLRHVHRNAFDRALPESDAQSDRHGQRKTVGPEHGFGFAGEFTHPSQDQLVERMVHDLGVPSDISSRCRPASLTNTSSRLACRMANLERLRWLSAKRPSRAGKALCGSPTDKLNWPLSVPTCVTVGKLES